ncbi:MAG: multifunctional CCA tRNA nucleotidyl transferase/2'3'-cyclic phosphodiesterase/2'nucleotidase/phosphatase [Candidatus Polarisedimenticolaceae bacterium]|nr:multifunctional CCA tRNA nucleotidyl transferase/2'3'-cyclic phosphodiesterase/2'nucleotidase/phosphatase [Candidatus Polarisedimenticolaceae bacterium]
MKTYLVGGAVRDQLLGLPVHECDWVVVGATGQQMLDAGFRAADVDFPVFLHSGTGEEYALARTETKTGTGYKGFEVDASPTVTLEQDLARRDLTINALAEDEKGQLIDLFGGQRDLEARQLRHITPAFVEDPVRLLRVARFAAHLGELGFEVAPDTQVLLQQMARSSDLQHLRPERIWQEMRKALLEPQPWLFFEVLLRCGALDRLIPELAAATNGDSTPFAALHKVAEQSDELAVRFAAALYPAAKIVVSTEVLCNRLRAEKGCSDLLDLVVRLGPDFVAAETAEARCLLQLLERVKAQQQAGRFQHFLLVCAVLWPDEAKVAAQRLRLALLGMNDVAARDLLAEGHQGAKLGIELAQRRIRSIEKRLKSIAHD